MPHTRKAVRLVRTPVEAFGAIQQIGKTRTEDTWDQIFILSLCCGAFIAFGSSVALMTGGNMPELRQTNPGIPKLVFGVAFSVGLSFTMLTGSQMVTGNIFMVMMMLLSKKTTIWRILHSIKVILITTIGNFAGAVLVGYFFVYLLYYNSTEPWVDYLKSLAVSKTTRNVGQIFASSIACNALVSVGIYMSNCADDVIGKIASIVIAISTFVILGYEHVVANMFFLPTAAMFGAPIETWRIFFWNLLPVMIGNYIGGGILVSGLFWYAHIWRNKHKNLVADAINLLKQKATHSETNHAGPALEMQPCEVAETAIDIDTPATETCEVMPHDISRDETQQTATSTV